MHLVINGGVLQEKKTMANQFAVREKYFGELQFLQSNSVELSLLDLSSLEKDDQDNILVSFSPGEFTFVMNQLPFVFPYKKVAPGKVLDSKFGAGKKEHKTEFLLKFVAIYYAIFDHFANVFAEAASESTPPGTITNEAVDKIMLQGTPETNFQKLGKLVDQLAFLVNTVVFYVPEFEGEFLVHLKNYAMQYTRLNAGSFLKDQISILDRMDTREIQHFLDKEILMQMMVNLTMNQKKFKNLVFAPSPTTLSLESASVPLTRESQEFSLKAVERPSVNDIAAGGLTITHHDSCTHCKQFLRNYGPTLRKLSKMGLDIELKGIPFVPTPKVFLGSKTQAYEVTNFRAMSPEQVVTNLVSSPMASFVKSTPEIYDSIEIAGSAEALEQAAVLVAAALPGMKPTVKLVHDAQRKGKSAVILPENVPVTFSSLARLGSKFTPALPPADVLQMKSMQLVAGQQLAFVETDTGGEVVAVDVPVEGPVIHDSFVMTTHKCGMFVGATKKNCGCKQSPPESKAITVLVEGKKNNVEIPEGTKKMMVTINNKSMVLRMDETKGMTVTELKGLPRKLQSIGPNIFKVL